MTAPPSAAAVEAVEAGLLAYLEPWLHFAAHGQPLRAELHNAAVIAARDAAPHIAAADRLAQRRRLIATCEAMDPPWNPDGVRSLLTQDGTIDGDGHVAQAVQAERERWRQLAIAVGARYVTGVRGQPECPEGCTYDGLMNLVTSGSHWHPFASLITDSDNALTSENTKGNAR